MKEIVLIAAVDRNWGIGRKNDLLFHLEEDMRFFREKTRGGIVIMGRATMESLPGGRPLAERVNVVLTHRDMSGASTEDGWIVCHSVDEVLNYIGDAQEAVYVIGGGMLYREFEPYATRALVTKIEQEKKADTFFPDLDAMSSWSLVSTGKRFCEDGVWGEFTEYEKLPGLS